MVTIVKKRQVPGNAPAILCKKGGELTTFVISSSIMKKIL